MIDKWVPLGILALVALFCSLLCTYLGYRLAAMLFLAGGIYYGIIAIVVFPPDHRDKNVRP